ncbi:phosphotransferase [Pandoraea commovens]|uniref:Aminoglycoside phosphotransferase family protein n=1 Tax=Pandoraea commovens TaxID=2508289 RepID=A0A5E4Z5C7_9BURK|nr:phosphotransferase [Pandoraea commovens]UVA78895.1 aminoglycoside phosphotransferase family protein [Pandoraea commovens]VVE56316.1 hypothetical protein PCO31010_05078 [Pandoraea commovens]
MLSKLRHFSDGPDAGLEASKLAVDVGPLLSCLGAQPDTLVRVQAGTLGICFTVRAGARTRFLKSHATPQGRDALDKEIALLDAAYAGRLHVERVECDGRLWLVTDTLTRSPVAPGIADVLSAIAGYEARLACHEWAPRMRRDDTMSSLVDASHEALAHLTSKKLIAHETAQQVQRYLTQLAQALASMPPVVCHGDLGPANLMHDAEGLVAVDWEDAFLGVAGYDFLYWLTFFDNRKHLSAGIFGHTPWPKEIDIAMLVMIVLLKCDLSVRAARVAGNALSFDQRLGEILALA